MCGTMQGLCATRGTARLSTRATREAAHSPCTVRVGLPAQAPRAASRAAQLRNTARLSAERSGSPSCSTLNISRAGLAPGDRAHRSAPAPRARAPASHPSAEANNSREVLCNPPGRVRRRGRLCCSTLAARRPARRARAERGCWPCAAPLRWTQFRRLPSGRRDGILRLWATQPAGRQRPDVPAGPPAEAQVSSRTRLLQPCRAAVPGFCACRASRFARRVHAARLSLRRPYFRVCVVRRQQAAGVDVQVAGGAQAQQHSVRGGAAVGGSEPAAGLGGLRLRERARGGRLPAGARLQRHHGDTLPSHARVSSAAANAAGPCGGRRMLRSAWQQRQVVPGVCAQLLTLHESHTCRSGARMRSASRAAGSPATAPRRRSGQATRRGRPIARTTAARRGCHANSASPASPAHAHAQPS